ncbi:PAS domain-containing protein [Rhodococcus opacus]|uniref:PAS domain-containing protein n=1 Tax=Rhodococcus opacus TaxID=37919 RepID=UPI0034D1A339
MPLGARPYNRTGFPRRTPALVLLARLPVPVLPLHRDGHVVHVNWAFEDMLGYPHDALSGRSIHDPVPTVSPPWPAAEDLRHSAGKVVTLTHRGGSTVRAAISKSVLEWEEDPVLIVQLCNQSTGGYRVGRRQCRARNSCGPHRECSEPGSPGQPRTFTLLSSFIGRGGVCSDLICTPVCQGRRARRRPGPSSWAPPLWARSIWVGGERVGFDAWSTRVRPSM